MRLTLLNLHELKLRGGCWLGSMSPFYVICNTLEYHKPRNRTTELQRRILFICFCDNLNFPQELLFSVLEVYF